jgi:CheY-like chemotaxis protein
MDAADREDALAAKLDELGADGWRLAEPLARAGVDDAWLEQVVEAAGGARVAALEWVAASLTATGLVAELHESTARISELVSAIKDYTHMDRAAMAEVDLHEGLDSTLTILGYRLKKGTITVERHYDRSLPRVTAHGSELNQVWTNLIVNSLDAIDGQGTITITTRRSAGGGVTVDIADDGPGIPPEQQSRVFDPFFTTKGARGTGLGLSIVYGIVRRMDGRLTVESDPGHGTRVEMRLPLCPPDAAVLAPPVRFEPETAAPGHALRVLIVDDELDVRTLLGDICQALGHEVTVCASATAALETFESGLYDVILSDLGMPGMTGWELVRAVREIDARVPIALVTGWGDSIAPEVSREAAVDLVISKPFTIEDIARALALANDPDERAA